MGMDWIQFKGDSSFKNFLKFLNPPEMGSTLKANNWNAKAVLSTVFPPFWKVVCAQKKEFATI